MEVMAALEEVRVITTHDDNLEKQYRESKFLNDCLDVLKPGLPLLCSCGREYQTAAGSRQSQERNKGTYSFINCCIL
jgi:hypothetical protein